MVGEEEWAKQWENRMLGTAESDAFSNFMLLNR